MTNEELALERISTTRIQHTLKPDILSRFPYQACRFMQMKHSLNSRC